MAIILLDRDGRLRSGQPQGGVGPKGGDDATGGTDEINLDKIDVQLKMDIRRPQALVLYFAADTESFGLIMELTGFCRW